MPSALGKELSEYGPPLLPSRSRRILPSHTEGKSSPGMTHLPFHSAVGAGVSCHHTGPPAECPCLLPFKAGKARPSPPPGLSLTANQQAVTFCFFLQLPTPKMSPQPTLARPRMITVLFSHRTLASPRGCPKASVGPLDKRPTLGSFTSRVPRSRKTKTIGWGLLRRDDTKRRRTCWREADFLEALPAFDNERCVRQGRRLRYDFHHQALATRYSGTRSFPWAARFVSGQAPRCGFYLLGRSFARLSISAILGISDPSYDVAVGISKPLSRKLQGPDAPCPSRTATASRCLPKNPDNLKAQAGKLPTAPRDVSSQPFSAAVCAAESATAESSAIGGALGPVCRFRSSLAPVRTDA